jgi:SAM-dependent methyltransferase
VDDRREAWERHAADWIAWARAPGHDSYWQFHRELFLELVPAPSGRTLDVGCGEGRLARDLAALGHDVVGVDASPTLLAAAREASPDLEFHLADAASLPIPDGAFGLVVAFMSLQDVDNLDATIHEAARVLAPGGRLCVAIVHPLNSAGVFADDDVGDSPFLIHGSYLDASPYTEEVERDGYTMHFESVHRPLQAYTEALTVAGLLIEQLREPRLPGHAAASERSERWRRIPLFLHLRALKPARADSV